MHTRRFKGDPMHTRRFTVVLAAVLAAIAWVPVALWACTPTVWTVGDLAYNLGAEDPETVVVRLFSTRDAVGEYGTPISGFRHVCIQDVLGAPAACPTMPARPRKSAVVGTRTPGPGPGPCYFRVVDYGQEPFGSDLTPAYCESINASYRLVIE